MYIVQCAMYNVRCTMCDVQCQNPKLKSETYPNTCETHTDTNTDLNLHFVLRILLTKITAEQNEVALIYHKVRGK